MPFEEHPTFPATEHKDVKLWRYMNLPKYLSLLQTRSLFLSNLEVFAKVDPFEGSFPASLLEYRHWNTPEDVPEDIRRSRLIGYKRGEDIGEDDCLQRYKEDRERMTRQIYAKRKSYYVNCWHISEYESSAMWDIYSRRNEGVAIVTSESRIKEAIKDSEKVVYGGVVTYANYTEDDLDYELENIYKLLLLKRQSFSYEREYRLAYTNPAVTHKKYVIPSIEEQKRKGTWFADEPGTIIDMPRSVEEIEQLDAEVGVQVQCNLHRLIDQIYVSPVAPDWFGAVIQDVTKKYGLDVSITKSSLSALPLQ